MTKEDIIALLGLEPHPFESGYFKRTYESPYFMGDDCKSLGDSKRLCTSIFYLLTKESPVNVLHRNKSDIIHCFHLGGAIKYTTVTEAGKLEAQWLGPQLHQGQQLQLMVPGGVWKAAQLCEGEYGLISEVVIPGFEYSDNEIATSAQVQALFPNLYSKLQAYLAKGHL